MKELLHKAIKNDISEIEAEQQLLILFKARSGRSDEKNMPPLNRKRIIKIIQADGNKCFYCGIETSPVIGERTHKSSTVDHVLPKSKGGIDHIDNCVNSCYRCNELKGSDNLFPPTVEYKQVVK
jgi:5-methylcytosine-specific restriction endonuclease McrA